MPFRQLFIFRECLRYPSATATGTLIGVLFGSEKIVARAQQSQVGLPKSHPLGVDTDSDLPEVASQDRTDPVVSDHLYTDSPHEIGYAVNVLLVSLSGSALFVNGTTHEDFVVKSVSDGDYKVSSRTSYQY